MNRRRVVGLMLLAALVGWLVLRSCMPAPPPPPAPPAPAREVFHSSKPLRVAVLASEQQADKAKFTWLEHELRYLLGRGKMRVAAVGGDPKGTAGEPFTLQIKIDTAAKQAQLALLAPDDHIERETSLPLRDVQRLAIATQLAEELPRFLGAVQSEPQWSALLGTRDNDAYEGFLQGYAAVLGSQAAGFTHPPQLDEQAHAVERLEALLRKHAKFARARALLALAYLSLGGDDHDSLARLASNAAERALTQDAALADAQAALGIASLRRAQWVTALEHFDAALALDANAVAALEGRACLLVDVGQQQAALQPARRALALQPNNAGAAECLVFAQLAMNETPSASPGNFAVGRVQALAALLSGDTQSAAKVLRDSAPRDAAIWIDPLLMAADNRNETSAALRAITRAAADGQIDPTTELICGAALRQSDFVFNRMLRLQRQNETLPLRLLWLPQTQFLRTHARFDDVIGAAALMPYWQEHGTPDLCARESKVHGCEARGTESGRKNPQKTHN